MSKNIIDYVRDGEYTDVVLRFRNVVDAELLKIELDLLLESLSEEGWILDVD